MKEGDLSNDVGNPSQKKSKEGAHVKLTSAISILLIIACSPGRSNSSQTLNILAKKLEVIEHKKVSLIDMTIPDDRINIPADVSNSDFVDKIDCFTVNKSYISNSIISSFSTLTDGNTWINLATKNSTN